MYDSNSYGFDPVSRFRAQKRPRKQRSSDESKQDNGGNKRFFILYIAFPFIF